VDQGTPEEPFDERAALEELERLGAQIQRLRSERTDAAVRFEQFVRTVRATGRPPDVGVTAAQASSTGSDQQLVEDAGTRPDPTTMAPVPAEPSGPLPPTRARPARGGVLIAGAVILLAASGVVTWTLRKAARAPFVPDPIVSEPPRELATPAPPPEVAKPSPVPSSQSEIVTSRAAWVRVVADGERVFERELAPGARVPFRALKSIVIRTGDAGAVRLSIRGSDQGPLGPDGAVVTRTFTVPRQ
jgi:hypothetical protein